MFKTGACMILAVTAILTAAAFQSSGADPEPPFASIVNDCRTSGACAGTWRGLAYDIAADGSTAGLSAASERWNMACKVDAMDDSRSCILTSHMVKDNPYFMAIWGSGFAGPSISVAFLGDAYPGSMDTLRIDANAPLSIKNDKPFGPAASRTILLQMARGKSLRLRAYLWPEEYEQDQTFDLTGFSAVIDASNAVRRANGL